MEDCKTRLRVARRLRSGLSIIELMVAVAISVIPISTAGILLVAGQRNWDRTYRLAHREIKADAYSVMAALGNVGRKSDRSDCIIYLSGASAERAVVPASGDATAVGESVEFRYWDAKGTGRSSRSESESEIKPNRYARFYPDEDQLRVDYGSYPYSSFGRPITNTVVLADNVTKIQFSQATLNGIGQSCVRMNMTLTDQVDGEELTVRTAILMRN